MKDRLSDRLSDEKRKEIIEFLEPELTNEIKSKFIHNLHKSYIILNCIVCSKPLTQYKSGMNKIFCTECVAERRRKRTHRHKEKERLPIRLNRPKHIKCESCGVEVPCKRRGILRQFCDKCNKQRHRDHSLIHYHMNTLEVRDLYCIECKVNFKPFINTGPIPKRCPTCSEKRNRIKRNERYARYRKRVKLRKLKAKEAA